MIKKFLIFMLLLTAFGSGQLLADEIPPAEKVYSDVNHSVFIIFDIKNNDFKHPVNYGSSIAVASDVVATNCHVALDGDERLIKIHDRFEKGTLIYKNEPDDLCLLRVAENDLKAVKFRPATSVKIGEQVFTIGSPKGYENSISEGIISNKIKYKNTSILQTDAAISPGSSGGGLFDTKSHLIGITFSKNEGAATEGIGFALPAEIVAAVVKKMNLI
jgi:serine protease Do